MQQPLLIDTQVLIWSLDDSPKLGSKSRRLLEDFNQSVVVSYFTLQEIAMKTGSGKLDLYQDEVETYLQQMGISVIAADRQVLRAYKVFNTDNKDPFDNLIIATACTAGYRLLTSDGDILKTQVRGLRTLDARI